MGDVRFNSLTLSGIWTEIDVTYTNYIIVWSSSEIQLSMDSDWSEYATILVDTPFVFDVSEWHRLFVNGTGVLNYQTISS